MCKKYLISFLLTCTMVISSTIYIFAEEQNDDSDSWLKGELAESFSQYDFTLADTPDSAELLNLKYMNLQTEIANNGYGKNYEITLPDSMTISGNAADLFNKEYADIDFSLTELEIPENFNPDDLLNQSKNTINNEYSEFVNSDNYKNIYKAVSTSKVTKDVSLSLSPDILMNNQEIQVILSNYHSDVKDEMSSQYEEKTTKYYDPYKCIDPRHTSEHVTQGTKTYCPLCVKKNIQSGFEELYLDSLGDTLSSRTEAVTLLYNIKSAVSNGAQTPEIDYEDVIALENEAQEIFGSSWEERISELKTLFNYDSDD